MIPANPSQSKSIAMQGFGQPEALLRAWVAMTFDCRSAFGRLGPIGHSVPRRGDRPHRPTQHLQEQRL